MATLIGDYAANHSSGFHTMIATQGIPYSQQHKESSPYRSNSQSRDSTPRRQSSTRQRSSSKYCAQEQKDWNAAANKAGGVAAAEGSGASRLPSPPDSSSPSGSEGSAPRSEDNLQARSQPPSQNVQRQAYMDSSAHHVSRESSAASSSTLVNPSSTASAHIQTVLPPNQTLPSPASDPGDAWSSSQIRVGLTSPNSQTQQTTIHVRDLAHVEALARSARNPTGVNDPPLQAMKYEISGMPIGDIIEMVAALLTKITTTNDQQHDALSRNAIERNASHVKQAQAQNEGSASEHSMSPMSSSVLAFHGKNVPAITILSYLGRIHKYCPTTYEVFLSLLVYFDRMTERVNDIVMKAEKAKKIGRHPEPIQPDVVMKDDNSGHGDDEDIADDDSDSDDEPRSRAVGRSTTNSEKDGSGSGKASAAPADLTSATSQPTFFVVDSFNIHRLVIAGVTCASKFFSDVFYTNSRYAKVGGLPLAELNHLEIQFLLLNDFRLAVPVEDLEAYATMLVEFYARDVVAQRSRHATSAS